MNQWEYRVEYIIAIFVWLLHLHPCHAHICKSRLLKVCVCVFNLKHLSKLLYLKSWRFVNTSSNTFQLMFKIELSSSYFAFFFVLNGKIHYFNNDHRDFCNKHINFDLFPKTWHENVANTVWEIFNTYGTIWISCARARANDD